MSQTENQADTPTIVNPAPPAAALNGDDGHTPPEVRIEFQRLTIEIVIDGIGRNVIAMDGQEQ